VALWQTVKKSAKVIIERYYPKLTLDFETNKRICDEIAIIASKRLRNKVLFFSNLSSCTFLYNKPPSPLEAPLLQSPFQASGTQKLTCGFAAFL
jgi:hypothetical protein